MRLFAAVDLTPGVVASLESVRPADERLRYVPAEQWHVTLAFYGDVRDTIVPELEGRLERAAKRTPPLRLQLRGAGSFPPGGRRARVLWCGLAGDLTALARLADRASAAGRRCGIAMEERPLHPHVTLARARGRVVDVREALDSLASYESETWTADCFHLVRSHLGPPTRHEKLAGWSLEARRER